MVVRNEDSGQCLSLNIFDTSLYPNFKPISSIKSISSPKSVFTVTLLGPNLEKPKSEMAIMAQDYGNFYIN